MKLKRVLLSLICAASLTWCYGAKAGDGPGTEEKYLWVQDTLKVLHQAGGFIAGSDHPDPLPDEERYYAAVESLFDLPFSEVEKLMNDQNHLTKAYGYLIATRKYTDSLTQQHLLVFDDKAPFIIYTRERPRSMGLPFGEVIKMFYESALENAKREETERK